MMGIESSQRLSHLGWLDRDELIARTNDVLKTFQHADIRPEKRVGDLSVAARQIVEISRALAANARIILMDEPTSSLQREDVAQLFTLIRKLSAEGISVIYISHFLEEVRQISDRFTVLRDGRIDQQVNDEISAEDDARQRVQPAEQEMLMPAEQGNRVVGSSGGSGRRRSRGAPST